MINEIELGMPVSALTKDVRMVIIMKPSVHYSMSKEVDNEMLTIQHAFGCNHKKREVKKHEKIFVCIIGDFNCF